MFEDGNAMKSKNVKTPFNTDLPSPPATLVWRCLNLVIKKIPQIPYASAFQSTRSEPADFC